MVAKGKNQVSPKHWWNRPLWGKKSMLQLLRSWLHKPQVSDGAIFHHNRELRQAQEIAKKAETIYSEKFSSEEFLLFVRIKGYLAAGVDEYEGLDNSAQLLKVAIETKNSFLTIEQIELRCRGSKQQEFYEFVVDLLGENLSKVEFRAQIQNKLAEVLPMMRTEEGRTALQSYLKELYTLSEHELGLELLSLFKQYQLTDFSVLKTISDIVNSLEKKDLHDLKGLVVTVKVNYEVFEKLGQIIGVPRSKSEPSTYGKIIQYIGLTYKYQTSYSKFQELVAPLSEWQKHYQSVIGVRQEYPVGEYKQPKDFAQEIPGMNLYLKYKNYLD